MIGLATKAGACMFGAFAVEKGVKSGKIVLVVADEGLSPAATKTAKNMCEYYDVPLIFAGEEGRLGRACGRPANKWVGITGKGFADRLLAICEAGKACPKE